MESLKVTNGGRDGNQTIMAQEKNKEFSEDAKFKYLEELEEVVKKYNETVRGLGEAKTEEIMKI